MSASAQRAEETRCKTCGAEAKGSPSARRQFCSPSCYQAARRSVPLLSRFLAKVNVNGPTPAHRPELGPCHIWTGARYTNGYGEIGIAGKPVGAHRVAFFLAHGRWPEPQALHKCDGGGLGCVRHDHIYEGTQRDNMADMMAKGRNGETRRVGSENGRSIITETDVIQIRALVDNGVKSRVVAERFGIGASAVRKIGARKSWRHI